MQDFIWHLIAGSFLFTAAGFAWTWAIYLLLSKKIEALWVRVTNHQEHDLDAIRARLDELERPSKARPL